MTFWIVLNRLIRDVQGNTLALVAACVFPLMGLVGGGIDMSRIYLTKARLQQACDAGALAGRKTMGGGAWNANNNQAATAALNMFDANFRNGSYGSSTVNRAFVESAGKVTGTVSTNLPMAIMRVFGFGSKTISVTCDAEMRLPNTDVMFVLDTTGSMNSTLPGDSSTKIAGLRTAVRCFYEIVARLDTVAQCDGGAPSGGTSAETQIRFGFVPYATNVNVGYLLPSTWFRDQSRYQSRERILVYGKVVSYSDGSRGNWSNWSSTQRATTATQQLCTSTYTTPTTIQRARSGSALSMGMNESNGGLQDHGNWEATQGWQDVERQFLSWSSAANGCQYRFRTRNFTRTFTYLWTDSSDPDAVTFNAWHYGFISFDLRALKNGNGWASPATVTLPIGSGTGFNTSTYYNDRTLTWNGCIEERQTVRATSYIPRPDGALDLDVNTPPGLTDESRWAPALGEAIYRRGTAYNDTTRSRNDILTFANFSANGNAACPTASRKLEQWADASSFDSYVGSLAVGGNTYHDIGLIWGARLMSPTGLFASENAATPRGGEIQRHVVFMTDGEACTSADNYQAYGMAWYDRRQTDENLVPTDGCSTDASPGTLTDQVNARTQAVCAAVKNMPNTTLWVVWFGTSQTAIENALRNCASGADRFFSAQNSVQLQQSFRRIANQISQLRLTN